MLLTFGDTMTLRMLNKFFQSFVEKYYVSDFQLTVCLYGELGRIPMRITRKLILIKYWLKLLTCDERTLLFKTYIVLKTDIDNNTYFNNKSNWAYHIKIILDECGLSYMWQN